MLFYAKQTQFKQKQSQLPQRVELMQSVYLQRIMKAYPFGGRKNKAKTNLIAKCRSPVGGRIKFLLFFFLNLWGGYADKNV